MKNLSLWKKLLFSICLLLIPLLIAYALTIVYRAQPLYSYAKGHARGWRSPAHRSDPKLGWAPVPGTSSAHTFSVGPDIPVQFDAAGFRIPVGAQRADRSRPLILALGCSFTYGDACLAEDTFPHKVAQALGGTELNAGVCGYGLAQMMLLAERLIPQYSPDYVLIQYSPWLLDRATAHFAPTYFYTYAPSPFFADTHAGGVEICPAVFLFNDIDLRPWRASRKGPLDFVSFLMRRALPLFIHNDISVFYYRVRRATGLIKKPTRNHGEVLRIVYGRINALCLQNKSAPLIIILGNSSAEVPVPDELRALGMPLVNAHAALISSLPEPTDGAYYRAYGHFRGSPPVCVDIHPNPRAHTLIATSIVYRIRAMVK